MKKITSIIACVLMLAMIFVACGTNTQSTTTSKVEGSTTTMNKVEDSTTTTTTPAITDPAIPECDEHVDENEDKLCDACGEEIEEEQIPVELPETTMYLVGDSTVASFADSYFYPRYGYGTQIANYLSEKVTVKNLALSGRSSRSFLSEPNYTTLKNDLKAGDILVIGFGHNDEKSDDVARFTDASLDYTDPASFGYHLYEYYIKLAEEKGAIPILCTPIVRAQSKDDYSGAEGHNTATGDYARAIRVLGDAYDVAVVDLTVLTRNRYEEIGFAEACYYHAVINGKYDTDGTTVIPDFATVDKTHLNIYGAKFVAYLFASEMAELDGIGGYVLDGIEEPTKDDLVANPSYKVPDYLAPNLEAYNAPAHFSTMTEGWYGTAFGNTGGSPQSTSNGYIAKEVSEGVFQVGQHLDSGSNKGKFQSADDGFAFAFRQVEANKNFKLTVSGKIVYTAGVKQAGFGLMLRDDCIIGQSATGSINSNYVTAGFYFPSDNTLSANFYRENTTLYKGDAVTGSVAVGDTFTMSIERVGQSVTVTVVYGEKTYTETYVDFDFFAVDTQYMYVGMFANRGTVIECTGVVFEITGESQGA